VGRNTNPRRSKSANNSSQITLAPQQPRSSLNALNRVDIATCWVDRKDVMGLLTFCQQRPAGYALQFTCSPPYKNYDNAHIEQKN